MGVEFAQLGTREEGEGRRTHSNEERDAQNIQGRCEGRGEARKVAGKSFEDRELRDSAGGGEEGRGDVNPDVTIVRQ